MRATFLGRRTLAVWGEDARGVHCGDDAMCLDTEGNIVAAAGYHSAASVRCFGFSPTGRALQIHLVPQTAPRSAGSAHRT